MTSTNGFTIEDVNNGVVAEFDNNTTLRVQLLENRILIGEHIFSGDVMLKTRDPFAFTLDGKDYRGNLRFVLRTDGTALQAVNHVPLESYLLGVVGAEMHSYWEPEALKAQAVAARTYCLYIKNRFGKRRSWDLSATQANQVYRGIAAETKTVEHAVQATAGQVLVCDDENGNERIFCSYYSSSCGGHTEDAKNVFGETVPPLTGVKCPYCKDIAKQRNFHWKPVTLTTQQVSESLLARYASLAKLEAIVDLEIIERGHLDRVTRVRLIGKNGKTDTVRGEDLRLSLDPTGRKLKSTLFRMTQKGQKFEFTDGRGFGHGVGLCQCGAQGKARKGADYREILRFYYPDSKLVTIKTKTSDNDETI